MAYASKTNRVLELLIVHREELFQVPTLLIKQALSRSKGNK